MKTLSVICLLLFVAIACDASANVTGAGSMSWSVQVAQDYSNGHYAGYIDTGAYQYLYLTNEGNGMYDGSLTDGFNSISARVNKPMAGDISGEVTAQSNLPGSTGSAGLDVVSNFMYYGTLTGLSYSYSFSGQKDSFGDNLKFIIQTEVNGFTGSEWVLLYSDYWNPAQVVYVVNDFNPFSTPVVVFDYPGVSFSPYNQFDVRLDFMIFADDFQPSNPVPIPSSIFLLGSGLFGLAGWRRFKKS